MPKRTIREAVIQTLKDKGEPMGVQEIYSKIIERDYYRFRSDNPQNIVLTEIRRHCAGIDFLSAKPTKHYQLLTDGRYWLNGVAIPGNSKTIAKLTQHTDSGKADLTELRKQIDALQNEHKEVFKAVMLNQLKDIDPTVFERFSKKVLEAYGFSDVEVTRKSKDGGIDGNGKLKVGIARLKVAFQSKRWKDKCIGRPEVDQFRGAIQGDYEQGILFTTSTFSKDALAASIKKGPCQSY